MIISALSIIYLYNTFYNCLILSDLGHTFKPNYLIISTLTFGRAGLLVTP